MIVFFFIREKPDRNDGSFVRLLKTWFSHISSSLSASFESKRDAIVWQHTRIYTAVHSRTTHISHLTINEMLYAEISLTGHN